MGLLQTLNLRKNQTSELSYAQMDANWTNIGTTVDANSAAIANKADLAGAAFTGNVSTTGKLGVGVVSPVYKLDVLDSTLTGVAAGSNRIAQFNSGASGRDAHIALGDSVNATARIGYLANAMYFWTNGAERMRVDGNGNLVVGGTTAFAKLHVYSPLSANTIRSDGGTNSGNNYFSFYGANAVRQGYVGMGSSDDTFIINNDRSAPIILATPGGNMQINAAGNVGIGTSLPGAKLDVASGSTALNTLFESTASTTEVAFSASGTSTSARIGISGNDLYFKTAGAEQMRINSAGSVGIGGAPKGGSGGFGFLELSTSTLMVQASTGSVYLGKNWYYNAGAYKYKLGDTAAQYAMDSTGHRWSGAASGVADGALTWLELMRLDTSGRLGIGITAPDQKLTVASGSDATNANDGVSFYGSSTNKQAAILSFNAGGFNGDLRFYTKVSGSASTTVTESVRIDPFGNVGVGVVPSAWGASWKAIQSGYANLLGSLSEGVHLASNAYYDGAVWKYQISQNASRYTQVSGNHVWWSALSGVAGATIAFTQAMTLDGSGNLLVGATSGSNHIIQKSVTNNSGNSILSVQNSAGAICVAVAGVTGTGYSATGSALYVNKDATTSRSINAAGTVNASGADYAEYMTKAQGCGTLAKGQIVGIAADGTLTDKWLDAVSFLIKSTNPSLVGGDSWFIEQPPEQPQYVAPAYTGSAQPGNAPHEPSAPAVTQPIEPVAPASDATDDAVAAYQAACAQYRTDLDAYTGAQVAYQASLSAYHVAHAAYARALDAFNADQTAYAATVQAARTLFDTATYPAYESALSAFNARMDAARALVDRIAYCGQVPCNVTGGKPGQYVVPVQAGDGIAGTLVDRAALTLDQYTRAVGVVQNILPDGRANVRVKPV